MGEGRDRWTVMKEEGGRIERREERGRGEGEWRGYRVLCLIL